MKKKMNNDFCRPRFLLLFLFLCFLASLSAPGPRLQGLRSGNAISQGSPKGLRSLKTTATERKEREKKWRLLLLFFPL
jgi:hypothetical protein